MSTRFKPTRAGIVNLWDYVDEQFRFADGRLILRGANGSGKTKALEVLFPFLLDGRLDPRRLDPFSGQNRTMKDNLLYRGTDSAYGYSWLEFTRSQTEAAGPGTEGAGEPQRGAPVDREGSQGSPVLERVTVGVGMLAQRHRPEPRLWFFVCDRTIGEDLDLVDAEGRPRPRKELAAILGPDAVFDTAAAYRAAIDQRLFGLGQERYEGMLELVLTLRRPMLAKDLDPQRLSETLSGGLRPLDDDLLDRAARSFEDLEAVQHELERLVAADRALEGFLGGYRSYVRTHARHRVDRLQARAGEAAAAAAEVARRQAELTRAEAEQGRLEAELGARRAELATARSTRDALKESPAYQAAGQLTHLESHLAAAARSAARAAGLRDRTRLAVQELTAQAAAEADALATARSAAAAAAGRLAGSARAAGVAWAAEDGEGPAEEVERRVRARHRARLDDVHAMRERLDALAAAERRAATAEEAVQRTEAALRDAEAAHEAAGSAVDRARSELRRQLAGWADALADGLLADGDLAALAAAVDRVGEPAAPTLAEVFAGASAPRRDLLAASLQEATAAVGHHDELLAEVGRRRQEVAAERDDAPAPLPARPAPRDGRPGAPLWRLVRFADGLAPAVQAAVEAGLEGAGLLDAWVRPDGAAEPATLDAFLVAGPPAPTPTLAEVLVPEEQVAVPAAVVRAMLASVSLAEADISVRPDGAYRLGPLAGAAATQAPRFVGATARAAWRRRRLAELDAQLTRLAAERAEHEARRQAVADRLAALAAAARALPGGGEVAAALGRLERAAGTLAGARRALDGAKEALARHQREVNDRRMALAREASARRLPGEPGALGEVTAALERLAHDGQELAGQLRLVAVQARHAASVDRQLEARTRERDEHDKAAAQRELERAELAAQLAALRAAMGAEAAEVLDRLAAVETRIANHEAAEGSLDGRVRDAVGTAAAAGRDLAAARDRAAAARQAELAAAERLAVFGHPDLAGTLGLTAAQAGATQAGTTQAGTTQAGTTAGATLAGATLAAALDAATRGLSPSEERLKAARTTVFNGFSELEARLGAGYQLELDTDDEIVVVTVADEEGPSPVAGFAERLRARRQEQEALLTEQERRVFEDALLAALCAQIQQRTLGARDLVAEMNRALRARRTSSGKTVTISWGLPDGAGPEQREVARLLERDPANLRPDELEAVRRHFAEAVKTARAARPTTSYRELLGEVLDYRSWRQFGFALVEADGAELPLTRRRHGRLSAGEKAASLHLPLFAAANAQFAGARPTCPRLLALDEAFAGIDDVGRGELLALSVAFDLDLFMTGYDLWGTYPKVPAVAHYDLLHLEAEHTVSTLLLMWNGHELIEGPEAA